MKPILLFLILELATMACGISANVESTPTAVSTESHNDTLLLPVSISSTIPAPHYVTTAPLHIRSCPSINCEIIGFIPKGNQVEIIILDLYGDGCGGQEWVGYDAGEKFGYLCSLYLMEQR